MVSSVRRPFGGRGVQNARCRSRRPAHRRACASSRVVAFAGSRAGAGVGGVLRVQMHARATPRGGPAGSGHARACPRRIRCRFFARGGHARRCLPANTSPLDQPAARQTTGKWTGRCASCHYARSLAAALAGGTCRRHRRRGARTRGELKKNTNFRTRGRRERARTSARVRSSPSASAMVLRRLMEPRRVDVSSWRSSSIRIAMGYSVSSPSAMPAAPRPPARCPPAPSPLPPALREARRARARARPRALPAPGRAGKRGGETASPPPPRALARATVAPAAGRGAWGGPTPPLPLPSARAREPLHWGGRLLYFDFLFFNQSLCPLAFA